MKISSTKSWILAMRFKSQHNHGIKLFCDVITVISQTNPLIGLFENTKKNNVTASTICRIITKTENFKGKRHYDTIIKQYTILHLHQQSVVSAGEN